MAADTGVGAAHRRREIRLRRLAALAEVVAEDAARGAGGDADGDRLPVIDAAVEILLAERDRYLRLRRCDAGAVGVGGADDDVERIAAAVRLRDVVPHLLRQIV